MMPHAAQQRPLKWGFIGGQADVRHLKVETSHHQKVAVTQHKRVFAHGRSFVPAFFSLETMMEG
jgi:hypothetical protein